MRDDSYRFREALLSMDRVSASKALDDAFSSDAIQGVENIVLETLESIGDDWDKGILSLSQVYMAGVLTEHLVTPFFSAESKISFKHPKTAIAVLEDHHSLGKRIVLSLMRAEGFSVIDYGHGISAEDLAEKAANDGIEILCISTLMLHSALRVRALRMELSKRDCFPRIIVGGAPFRLDTQLWKDVGADEFCRSASDIFELMPGRKGVLS